MRGKKRKGPKGRKRKGQKGLKGPKGPKLAIRLYDQSIFTEGLNFGC